jgi:hypothetical protein
MVKQCGINVSGGRVKKKYLLYQAKSPRKPYKILQLEGANLCSNIGGCEYRWLSKTWPSIVAFI